MPHTKRLNIRQRLAAQFLAAGLTRDQTAKRIGIDPTTLSKWRRIPEFEEHINGLLAQHERDSAQTLLALKLKAIERLSDLLGSTNDSVALRAIEVVFKQALPHSGPSPNIAYSAWQQMQQELERISKEANHVI